MENKPDTLKDESIDEEFNSLIKDERFDISKEKVDLRSALRVIEGLILQDEVNSSTKPSEIRDLIANKLKEIKDL